MSLIKILSEKIKLRRLHMKQYNLRLKENMLKTLKVTLEIHT